MERTIHVTLKKRGRSSSPERARGEESIPAPKRTRTKKTQDETACQNVTVGTSTVQARSGLLTPEASSLAESQITSQSAVTADKVSLQPFPFMKLPAELRINIYHMALVREQPLLLHTYCAPEKPEGDHESDPTSEDWSLGHIYWATVPSRRARSISPGIPHAPLKDPIIPSVLRLNDLIYKEARQVLYSSNVFVLSLTTSVHTLATLHQRSRSLIKHVVLTIPSHHDLLDGFADLVRLGLRYCWGLKTFQIILQASLPDDGKVPGTMSVYANAFHILRWLPRGCSVVLEGNVSGAVKKVVAEEGRLQSVLDESSYLKRQHQMPERHWKK